MIRSLATAVVLTTATLLSSAAYADSILVQPGDFTGSRSIGNGLEGTGDWADSFEIAWEITFDANTSLYTYAYTLSNAPSHFTLEVSENFGEAEFTFIGDTDGPRTFSPGDDGNSNPNLPGDIFAVKFDEEQATYTFTTDRAPIWGDVYGKGGRGPGTAPDDWNTVWNTGFGTDPGSAPFTNWIATPDTVTTQIPAPAAFGGGLVLLGLATLRRRRLA